MTGNVVLREFSGRAEAEIVRELLEAAGIPAEVDSDDCGMVDPALQFGRGVMLRVAAEDVDRAERVIAAGLAADGASAEAEFDEGDGPE